MNKQLNVMLTLSVVSFILGLMLAIAYASTSHADDRAARGASELRLELQRERERTQTLLNEIRSYKELLTRYESAGGDEQDPLETMEEERLRLRRVVGLEPVEGKGLIIRIEQRAPQPGRQYEFAPLIYDEDLRLVVNELNDHGAEAIAINGQRIIAQSAIRNVGDQILVNTRPIGPPYEIKVIGDAQSLIPALRLAGLEEYFDIVSHDVSFEEKEKLTVPAYAQELEVRFMQPLKEEKR